MWLFGVDSFVCEEAGGCTLVSSVLPTPVGPQNMRAAMGRLGSFSPTRTPDQALTTASTSAVLTRGILLCARPAGPPSFCLISISWARNNKASSKCPSYKPYHTITKSNQLC
ncbi:MAG: hypothetical protein FRX49_03521 [Trebouxia sp. A1-2]|nr:MAG: hypothetical protein FRX49_03521 [Trebouxia sp. A1-2]